MYKLALFCVALFVPLSLFAEASVSLGVVPQETDGQNPVRAEVVIKYGDENLWDIYIDGLDNFTLISENRSDSQWFSASGSVNIIAISLDLLPKHSWTTYLWPVVLIVDGREVLSQVQAISVNENSSQQNTKQYTAISSVYFQDRAFKVSTLKSLTVLFVIIWIVVFLAMFWMYRKNLEIRKYWYIQVLHSLDAQAFSKKAPKQFYTDLYNLFHSYLKHEKKTAFGWKNIKDMKQKLSKKEFDILDLVYNIDYNRSKDSPKYRRKLLKELHKYFDKNIV